MTKLSLVSLLVLGSLAAACTAETGHTAASNSDKLIIHNDDGTTTCVTGEGSLDPNDPFESQLANLGCVSVKVVDYGAQPDNYWKSAACPPSADLDSAVSQFADNDPYLSQYADRPCPEDTAPDGYKWVSWDPTCPSCKIPVPKHNSQ